ncbi:MAG: PQQ-binding-like beta-propeller repeat protein [Pirellulaceae bacterium]
MSPFRSLSRTLGLLGTVATASAGLVTSSRAQENATAQASVVAQASAGDAEASGEWTQWRGPRRDGTVVDERWGESLDESNLVRKWRVDLGPSYSGPIVTATQVFVTETVDEQDERVTALDRATGERLWSVAWPGAMQVPFFAKANGDWIRSTPAYADGLLYVAGMRDVLVCLDGETGQEVWRFDFPQQLGTPLPDFGFVCSPLVDGDYVYVQAGGGFVKLDRKTGELVWKSLDDGGGMMGSAFSSPIKASIEGVDQFLVQTRESLCGVSAEDGTVLWRQEVPAFRGMNILTPTVVGNRIFTSSYGGESFLYEIKQGDDQWSVETVWSNRQQGYMSSPVVINDHLFLHLRNQRFTCLDLEDGEAAWTSTPFGKYWSLVANGNLILALDERGELLLIDADPAELKIMSRREVVEAEAWAHVAVCGGQIFVRDLNGLSVFDWKTGE